MAYETEALFREDAYLKSAEGSVLAVTDTGGIILDQTNFYATSGGQPGDTGFFERADGSRIEIAATVTGESKTKSSMCQPKGRRSPRLARSWFCISIGSAVTS